MAQKNGIAMRARKSGAALVRVMIRCEPLTFTPDTGDVDREERNRRRLHLGVGVAVDGGVEVGGRDGLAVRELREARLDREVIRLPVVRDLREAGGSFRCEL